MPRHSHSPSLAGQYHFRPSPQSPTTPKKNAKMLGSHVDHEASRNRIEWLSSLDTETKPGRNYRRTSIICTIGTRMLVDLVKCR